MNYLKFRMMKTKALFLVIAVMLTIVGLNAQKKVVYSNVMETASGVVKEYTTVDAEISAPLMKNTYVYDNAGFRLQKTTYIWNQTEGWKECLKMEYRYTGSNVISISCIQWNEKKKEWNTPINILHPGAGILLAQGK